jgi:hypothetical protein
MQASSSRLDPYVGTVDARAPTAGAPASSICSDPNQLLADLRATIAKMDAVMTRASDAADASIVRLAVSMGASEERVEQLKRQQAKTRAAKIAARGGDGTADIYTTPLAMAAPLLSAFGHQAANIVATAPLHPVFEGAEQRMMQFIEAHEQRLIDGRVPGCAQEIVLKHEPASRSHPPVSGSGAAAVKSLRVIPAVAEEAPATVYE